MAATKTYALRFIAGKYKGGEFPLRPNREIIVGRGSEFDMVLDEDMVSRRHAKIATYHGQIVLQDLKSTNGTFVNGERVTVARLQVGDKVLVGTSIMELVQLDRGPTSVVPSEGAAHDLQVPAPDQETQEAMPAQYFRPTAASPAVARPTIDRSEGMSGRFPDDDVNIPDLVELFVGSGRTGVLVLSDDEGREGRVFFRQGSIYYATIAEPARPGEQAAPVAPKKCFFRLLTWTSGGFRMDGLDPAPQFEDEITGGSRQLLVEGLRQFDELKRYEGHLLPREARIAMSVPLTPRLSALSAEALDTLQVAVNFGEVGPILDYSEASDLETWQDLLYLMQNGYLYVASG